MNNITTRAMVEKYLHHSKYDNAIDLFVNYQPIKLEDYFEKLETPTDTEILLFNMKYLGNSFDYIWHTWNSSYGGTFGILEEETK